jgi:hypothetical protein
MPRVKDIAGPYRLFFYSFDCNEPKHVHVRRERMVCKFWLEPLELCSNHGFSARELTFIRNEIGRTWRGSSRRGMSTAVSIEPRVKTVSVTDDQITFELVDGRTVSVPLAWSWRLSEATPEQRARYEIIGDGQGVHWPDVDEDLSAQGMLTGVPARRALP